MKRNILFKVGFSKKYFAIIISIMPCISLCFGQKKIFEETISKRERVGDYYFANVSGSKNYSVEDIKKYCEDNSFKCFDFKTKTLQKFGGYKQVVSSFYFISNQELQKFTEIDKVNSTENAKMLMAKYLDNHKRIEEKYLLFCKMKIKQGDINYLNEFDKVFPLSTNYNNLEHELISTIETNSSITIQDILKLINEIPNKKNAINTQFDLKNEKELSSFFTSFKKATKLSQEGQNAIIFKILDTLPKILTNIHLEYEKREFELSKQQNNVTAIRNFLIRFPNTNLKAEAKTEINKLDEQAWRAALFKKSIEGYNEYLDKFSNGLHAKEATQKGKDIINAQLRDEIRRAEIRNQEVQEEIRQETQRVARLKSADIGDKLCFTFLHEEYFFGVSTERMTVTVVCFIEARNKDRFKVTVSDYLTERYKYYHSVPTINGIKFNKNESKWVKPFEDSRWDACD